MREPLPDRRKPVWEPLLDHKLPIWKPWFDRFDHHALASGLLSAHVILVWEPLLDH